LIGARTKGSGKGNEQRKRAEERRMFDLVRWGGFSKLTGGFGKGMNWEEADMERGSRT